MSGNESAGIKKNQNKTEKNPKQNKQTNKKKPPRKKPQKQLQLLNRATSGSWRPQSELGLERLDFNQLNFIENLENERNGSYNAIYLDKQRERLTTFPWCKYLFD